MSGYYLMTDREPLTRLHVEFPWFCNESGKRVFLKGATDFLLHKHLLDHGAGKVREILKQRAGFGVNCVRVIGMARKFPNGAGIADWKPQDYGERWFDTIPELADLCGEFGVYLQYCVFAAAQTVYPGFQNQYTLWMRFLDIAERCPNIAPIELVNERYSKDNDVDNWEAFPMATFTPCSSGSYNDKYLGGGVPAPSRGSVHMYHPPRDGDDADGFKYCADLNATPHPNFRFDRDPVTGKARKRQPIYMGEPQKFGDPSLPEIYRGNGLLTNPKQARMMAGSARGTTAGIDFHTVHGVYSELWDGIEQACAREWFDELR